MSCLIRLLSADWKFLATFTRLNRFHEYLVAPSSRQTPRWHTTKLFCSCSCTPNMITSLSLSSSWAADLITCFNVPKDIDSESGFLLQTKTFPKLRRCRICNVYLPDSSTVDFTVVCTARHWFSWQSIMMEYYYLGRIKEQWQFYGTGNLYVRSWI